MSAAADGLIAGGVAKLVYDLLLLALFRRVRPPDESRLGIA